MGKSNDPEYIASVVKKALPARQYFEMFIESNIEALYMKNAQK